MRNSLSAHCAGRWRGVALLFVQVPERSGWPKEVRGAVNGFEAAPGDSPD